MCLCQTPHNGIPQREEMPIPVERSLWTIPRMDDDYVRDRIDKNVLTVRSPKHGAPVRGLRNPDMQTVKRWIGRLRFVAAQLRHFRDPFGRHNLLATHPALIHDQIAEPRIIT